MTPSPVSPATVEPLLVVADVHLSFGATRALAGASFELLPGEVLALLGPSGSGKSTLLHCGAGILQPDRGAVTYRGHRIDCLPDEQRSRLRRSDFGFVFQFGSLVPELSAVENVALPLRLTGRSRRAAEAAAHDWLQRLDVPDVAAKRAGEMSGGQAQRVAVARALVHGPRVLFADEPTGALDTYHGERVMELLMGFARTQGTSVVLVTHDERVAAYAHREVLIRDGSTRKVAVA